MGKRGLRCQTRTALEPTPKNTRQGLTMTALTTFNAARTPAANVSVLPPHIVCGIAFAMGWSSFQAIADVAKGKEGWRVCARGCFVERN